MQRMLPLSAAGSVLAASTFGVAYAAQPPQRPAPAPATAPAAPSASVVQGVTVTGQGAVSVGIDRRSYSVANDLRATTGSLADALRNVPTVDVDVQGNISLRGDPSVTILIDGRPAPQFEGPSRADALQALPAANVDRVEVMTSPSAEFSSQGTGGVINIVTKQARGAGPTATVRGALGSVGRTQAGLTAGFNADKLSVTADASFRHDPRSYSAITDTEGTGGTTIPSRNVISVSGSGEVVNAGVRLDYTFDSRTRLNAQARTLRQTLDTIGYVSSFTGPSLSSLTTDYGRTIAREFRFSSRTLGAGLRRTFSGEQHEFTVDYQHVDMQRSDRTRTDQLVRRSLLIPGFEDFDTDFPLNQDTFKTVYRRPMPGGGRLVLGYDQIFNDLRNDTVGLRGESSATASADPRLANRYRHHELQRSLYGTYQQVFGDFTVLGGLRLERTDVDGRSPLLGTSFGVDYSQLNPSLNLAYKLTDRSKLSFGYSRRIERPNALDYNPGLIYNDPLSFRQGDPSIRPAKTDAFEAVFEHRKEGATYLATFYYRHNMDVLTAIVRPLGEGVFVVQRANAAESFNGGLELVADGRITSKLRYNVNGNLFHSDLRRGVGFGENQSGWVISGRANLNWSPNATDLVQANLVGVGRALLPQGYVRPRMALNLGYRRKMTERVFLTLTGEDVLGTFGRSHLVLNSPSIVQRQDVRFQTRAVIVGLSYAFGGPAGRPRTAPNLEYGGGGGGP